MRKLTLIQFRHFHSLKYYFLSLLLFVAGTILLFEFIIWPLWHRVNRDYFLMGFCATNNVDDTPINRIGFTGDVPVSLDHPSTIRILTLGGSTMFNRRLTLRLKDKLQSKTNQRTEVLGAALRSHTSQSSIYKYEFLSKYKFDYVLICEGINDLWANNVVISDFKDDYSHLSPWYKRNFFLSHSIICRLFYNQFVYKKSKYVENGSNYRSIKTYKRNLEYLIDLIRKDGGVPILMTFAWNIPENYNLDAFNLNMLGFDNPNNYDKCPVEVWGSVKYVRDGLRQINSVIHEVVHEKHVLLIDQNKMMSLDISLFSDICHFSEKGTDQFIDNIVKFFLMKNEI